MTTHSPAKPRADQVAQVPFFDGSRQAAVLMPELRAAMDRVIASQRFILGEEVAAFEREISSYIGVKHAIGVSSGTDALTVALLALGIGPGDEVITTPYTFFATTGAILRVGATPVFADIDAQTFNLDPAGAERAITPRTRAILPVHLFGQPADMRPLKTLAVARSLALIEDAAQALGATFGGERVGSLGRVGCFSFFPTKNLGAFGDGGLVTTNDDAIAESARALRNHGFSPKHYSRKVGGNFRLDALQAAILRAKLPHLDRWNELRRGHARHYSNALQSERKLGLPRELPDRTHVFNQFVIRSTQRDALSAFLAQRGIGTECYYPFPIHLQHACAHLGYAAGDFPVAEACARECLALPVYPELETWMLDVVSSRLREFSAL